jgi:hypothetical protein
LNDTILYLILAVFLVLWSSSSSSSSSSGEDASLSGGAREKKCVYTVSFEATGVCLDFFLVAYWVDGNGSNIFITTAFSISPVI